MKLQDVCLKDKIRFEHKKDHFGSNLKKKINQHFGKKKSGKRYLKARVIKAEAAVSLDQLFRSLPAQETEDFNVSQKEERRFGCNLEVVEKKEKSQI